MNLQGVHARRLGRPRLTLIASLAGFAAVCLFALLARPFGGGLMVAFIDVAELAAAFVAGACALWTASIATGRVRSGWLLVGAGSISWGMGEVVWTYYEVVLGRETPSPSPADALFLTFLPLTFAGIVIMTSPAGWNMRLRNGLDALAIATAGVAVAWDPLIRPVLEEGDHSLFYRFVAAAYPLGDLALLFALMMALPRNRSPGVARVLIVFSLGLSLYAAADLAFVYVDAASDSRLAGLVGAGWVAGFSLFGVAAKLCAACSEAHGAGREPETDGKPSRLEVLPLATLPFLAAWLVIRHTPVEGADVPAMTAGVMAIALVVGRQVLSFSDTLDANRKLAEAQDELAHANVLLKERNIDLELDLLSEQERSSRDALTGILNRGAIEAELSEALAEADAARATMAVALVDIDSMKRINDRYGHQQGDMALQAVAAVLSGSAGATAGRIGGDEFLVVLRQGGRASSAMFERGVRRELREQTGAYPGGALDISLGMAVYPDDGVTVEQVIAVADSRMYQMKASKHTIRARAVAA